MTAESQVAPKGQKRCSRDTHNYGPRRNAGDDGWITGGTGGPGGAVETQPGVSRANPRDRAPTIAAPWRGAREDGGRMFACPACRTDCPHFRLNKGDWL